ncbi:MAG: efflux RND transporter permease subunit [Thermoplasmatota archaeon]
MNLPEKAGQWMAWSVRHRRQVLTVMVLLDLLAISILAFVPPNVATDVQAGTFPRDDVDANAFRALRDDVSGINSELVYFELLPDAQADGQPVTDTSSIEASRSVEALYEYVDRRFQEETGEDKVLAYTGFPYLVKLVYSYFPGGSFALPETQEEYDSAVQVLEATDDGSLAFYFSDDKRATIISILYDPSGDQAATAGLINDLIAEYRALPVGAEKPYDLWNNDYLDAWGVQSWIAIVDRSVERDLGLLVPISLVVLTVILSIALRDVRRAMVAMLVVGTVLLWTLASMTALGLSVGFISMALFPLLLGVGVDYAIHVQHEALTAKRSPEDAMRHAGRRAGVALVVATVTTIAGFLVIMLSGAPMIIEVGTATVIGMALMLVASLTLLPAMTWGDGFRASDAWTRAAGWLAPRRRYLAAGLMLGVLVLLPLTTETRFATQTVQANLPDEPEPSHMLVMYDRFEEVMETTGNEAIIHQGDLTRPAAMEELIQTHLAMEDQELFDGVLSLPFVLDLKLTLDGGPLGPAQSVPAAILAPILEPVQGEPERFAAVRDQDQAGLTQLMDDMWSDDRWIPLIRSFTNADYDITWTFSFLDIPSNDETTARAVATMQAVLAQVNPTELEAHSFGTLTALDRINEQAADWLLVSAIVDLVVLGALVGWVTRSWRAIAASTTALLAGMIVWLALLSEPVFDLRLSFVYLIPLAFVTSLGSDYAVHLVNGLVRGKDAAKELAGIGRAVVFSALTTGCAFAVFLAGSIPGSVEMFAATVVAVLTAAVVTLAWVPAWFRVKPVTP